MLLREPDISAADQGDIDLLVHPDDLASAIAVGRELGAARLVSRGRGSHTFLISYSREDRTWYEFDIVTEIAFGVFAEFPVMPADALLARRICVTGSELFRLPDEELFWLNALHCALDKGHVSRHRAATIAACNVAHVNDAVVLDATSGLVGSDVSAALAGSARAGDWAGLVVQADELRSILSVALGEVVPRRRRAGQAGRAFEKLAQWPSRRGLAVALIGPDGSGKSTLSTLIIDGYGLPIEASYFGLWKSVDFGSRLRQLVAIPVRPLRALGIYSRGLTTRARGRSVIFDRYPIDARLPAAAPLARLKDAYMWVVARSCPSPDAVVLLDVPAEVMFARKGELGVDHLDRMRREYQDVVAGIHAPTLVVDGTQPADEVAARVVDFMWSLHRERLDRGSA